jgi:hypothetical protein
MLFDSQANTDDPEHDISFHEGDQIPAFPASSWLNGIAEPSGMRMIPGRGYFFYDPVDGHDFTWTVPRPY